ncbi:glycosyltransferase family 2 protein [Paenibacillus sp. 481]|uniref:glycosyltransferase family 2 protein n=1 Tax=Paenibacillus sp. 481 TaxID=2835869 RepID=UPI001E56A2AD|nr:glycosyltransferase [Paenibacillus sp. 481]UHA73734.1 glycosyltransferase family 2 protein [Paenibacillus sp. 481]
MNAVLIIGVLLFVSFLLIQGFYIVTTFFHAWTTRRANKAALTQSLDKSLDQISMSVLIPAYNEEKVISNCIKGMLNLHYERYEVIIINDGSTDDTLPLLHQKLELYVTDKQPSGMLAFEHVKRVYRSSLYPNFIVIDKYNGGKADSLNAGADYATGDILITLDADSILERQALHHINTCFHDRHIIAAGGMIHVGQMYDADGKPTFKGKGLLKYQVADYVTAFYVKKVTQSRFNLLTVVSGAFGAFKRELVYEINGYKKSLGEDMEVTVHIQQIIHEKYKQAKLVFLPEAVCFTEVPENFSDLTKQRIRWQKGLIDCLNMYKAAFFKQLGVKYSLFMLWEFVVLGISGKIMILLLPFIFLSQGINELTISLLIILALAQLLQRYVGFYAAAQHGYRLSFSDYMKVSLFSIIEIPTYRLLDVYYYTYGTISYFTQKNKHNWNKVKRLGNVESSSR